MPGPKAIVRRMRTRTNEAPRPTGMRDVGMRSPLPAVGYRRDSRQDGNRELSDDVRGGAGSLRIGKNFAR